MARGRARPLPRALRRLGDETGGRPAEDADASGQPLVPPLQLRRVAQAGEPSPGRARLLPARWAAFVDVDDDDRRPVLGARTTSTPSWPSRPRSSTSRRARTRSPSSRRRGSAGRTTSTPAEDAGMVVRIPIAALPDRPTTGYDRLVVVGVAAGKDHGDEVGALLDAHRYTRGLDLIPPGTATNVTDQAPEAAGAARRPGAVRVRVRPRRSRAARRPPGTGPRSGEAGRAHAQHARRAPSRSPSGCPPARPSTGPLGADDPEPELSRAANQALWPATWDAWLSDQMRWADDGSPLLAADDDRLPPHLVHRLRPRGGPAADAARGPHPYGLLPVSTFERRDGGAVLDHLENTLLDLLDAWNRPGLRAAARPGRLGRRARRGRRGAGVRRRRDLRSDAAHPRAPPAPRRRHLPRPERPLLAADRHGRS